MGEEEKQNSLSVVKRDRTGGVSVERPPEAMIKSQPMPPPRAMSGSVSRQQQGSVSKFVARITIRDHGNIPGPAARDHVDVQGIVQNCSLPHWQQCSGALPLPLSGCSIQERGACTSSGQHNRADTSGGGTGELPQGMSMGELAPPLMLMLSSLSPSPPEVFRRSGPEAMRMGEVALPLTGL